MPAVQSAVQAAALDEFYTARADLQQQIGKVLARAKLPAYSNTYSPESGLVHQSGWTTVASIGRGIVVNYAGATADYRPTLDDLAPHRRALEKAGLRVKRHPDLPALLVFAPPPNKEAP